MVNTLKPKKNPVAKLFLGFTEESGITGSLETMIGSTEDGNKLKICLSYVSSSSTLR
ncbi:hypothetical protein ES708_11590 [subsurface metagenome]